MKYWQHSETGNCCSTDDDVDLMRRHVQITEDQYKLHEYPWLVEQNAALRAQLEGMERAGQEQARRADQNYADLIALRAKLDEAQKLINCLLNDNEKCQLEIHNLLFKLEGKDGRKTM